MRKYVGSLDIGLSVLVAAGCGSSKPEPAKTTPEVAPESQASMKKAMEGGGGPEMIRKMQEQGQTKPQ